MCYYKLPLLNWCFCCWITTSFTLGIWPHFLTSFCKSYSFWDPFPALSSISVISSGMPSVQGSTILYSQWSLTSLYLHFTPLLPKSILSYSFIHTYAWKKATPLLRRKFHKGLIISFYSPSHQWIGTLFICFEAQKAVGEGQFEGHEGLSL